MNKRKIIAITAIVFLMGGLQAFTDKLTAYDVMKRTYAAVFYAGKDASCDVQMTYLGDTGGSEKWNFKFKDSTAPPENKNYLFLLKNRFNL